MAAHAEPEMLAQLKAEFPAWSVKRVRHGRGQGFTARRVTIVHGRTLVELKDMMRDHELPRRPPG